ELIEASDLVVAFGASLNMWTTRRGHGIGTAARVAQVDLDAAALGAHRPIDLGLEGDCATTARALHEALGSRRSTGWRGDEIAERIRHGGWREQPFDDVSGDGRIDPRALTVALHGLLPKERTLAVDSGHFMGWAPMDTVKFPETDFVGLARPVGLEAATVRGLADLEVLREWLDRGRPAPLLLDAKVVPSVVAEWLEEAFRGH